VQERRAADEQTADRVAAAVGQAAVPMEAIAALGGILDALPPGTAVVDEAITSGLYLRTLLRCEPPGSYHFARGGGLGWGLGAALGVQLARPGMPVVCVIGDGSAMYGIQALWTAAHANLPVVVTVINNRQYAILKRNLIASGSEAAQAGRYVGLDLDQPPVDFAALAASVGVSGSLVEKAAEVPEAVRAAFASGRPTLLEIPVAPPSLVG
jgi:benzoylformate decarboxylase